MADQPLTREQLMVRDRLRTFVGRTAVAQCGRHKMLVQVIDIHVDHEGWSAVLCHPAQPEEQWKIGHFTWTDEFRCTVLRDYWHIPLISERYLFDEKTVASVRAPADVEDNGSELPK